MAQKQLSAAERNMMRQDALRRQREMKRASCIKPAPPPPPPEPPRQEPPRIPQTGKAADNPLEALLGSLDQDRLILLALLFVIWREGGDTKLLAALAYVLL